MELNAVGWSAIIYRVIATNSTAVIFHRLGPYHHARLRVAGRLLPIVAIESSGVDETYAWDKVAEADHFECVTLYDRADARNLPAAEVASCVGSALDRVQPTVVVVPGWADSAALGALHWCVQNHVPAIVMSESTAWDKTRSVWREAVKRRIVGLCSAALVGGTPHKDYMVQLGMPAERVFVGYDAVDNEYFAQGAKEVSGQWSVVREKHGLPEKYFLASARFVEQKNLPRLIEAYARYRTLCEDHRPQTTDNGPSVVGSPVVGSPSPVVSGPVVPWDLVLLGDGPLRSSILNLRSSLGLDDHVLLPGFKQYGELPTYYGLAKTFIHASTTEQWGLVVNEAMASDLPVLVSNRCGCAMDLVKDGVNGFAFDPYNVEQLAQLMFQISLRGVGFSGPEAAFNSLAGRSEAKTAQLSAFGSESQRIISQWGPERFAKGLKEAVDCALSVGPVRPTLVQRMILKAMLLR